MTPTPGPRLPPSRSPLLQRLPAVSRPGRAARLGRRWIWTLILVAVVAGLVVLVDLQVVPAAAGLDRALYWLHDQAYLPLKGRLWTQGYPIGLGNWLTLLVLVGAVVIAVLSDRPLSRRLHIRATRWCLYHRPCQRLLPLWARAMKWVRLRPQLLEEVVDAERQAHLDAAQCRASTHRVRLEHLWSLTLLQIRLTLAGPRDQDVETRCREILGRTLVAWARCCEDADRASQLGRCWDEVRRLRASLFREPVDSADKPATPEPAPFSPARLAADLDRAWSLARPPGRAGGPSRDRQRHRLLEGIEERRRALDIDRSFLERRSRGWTDDKPAADRGQVGEAALRLAMDLSLLLSLTERDPTPALAFQESLEALAFAAAASALPDAELPSLARSVRAHGVPAPGDLRILSELLALEQTAYRTEIEALGQRRLLDDRDLELAGIRRDLLDGAANTELGGAGND